MTTNRDHLDESIDSVAKRMTRVEENDAFATHIINALPERSIWTLHWLVPRLAITAALGIAATFIVLRSFDNRATDVRTFDGGSTDVQLAVAAAEHRTDVEPPLIVRRTVRRTTVERSQNDPGTLDVPDHERSLPALGAVTALAFDSLAPVSLPEDAPLTLKPLEIADLPLTADSFSPR